MRTTKPVVSLLLARCMLIVLVPQPPAAAEELSGKCGGDAVWTLSADGTLTVSGTGELTSGSRFGGNDYDSSWPWHKQRDSVKAIVVKEGITSIGTHAFTDCVNATKVTLPSSLKTIKTSAFYRCSSLEEVSIPQGVTEIGALAFATCYNLKQVFLPVSVTKVDRAAFDYTI